MSPAEILILLALTVYAVYRQSVRHEVTGKSRHKMALIYGIVGLSVGGFYLPPSTSAWLILAGSIALSIVVGIARGKLTRLWKEPDGRIFSQGTPLTIALFLLLVGSKWIIGAFQYIEHAPTEHGGFGEVMILIALMLALQAEIIWHRAAELLPAAPAPVDEHATTAV